MTDYGGVCDVVKPSAAPDLEPSAGTSEDGASVMADLDQLQERQEPSPSGRQTGDEPTSAQPTCDEPNGDQPTDDEPTGFINAEKLIAEVQKCPHIYNNDFNEYCTMVATQKQWFTICECMFPEWYTFDSRKMKEIAIRTQKKWAQLREPFFKKLLENNGGVRKHAAADQHNHKVPFRNIEPTPSTSTHIDPPGNIADNLSNVPRLSASQVFSFELGVMEGRKNISPAISAHTSPNINEGIYRDYTPPETRLYSNPVRADTLYTMFTNLKYDQQRAVWPKLLDLIAEAAEHKPKNIKILQSELLLDDEQSSHFVAATEQFSGPEQLLVQEMLAESELVAQETLAEPEVEEAEEEPIYPSSYGRPTNAQGEIIYPETDHEDLDD